MLGYMPVANLEDALKMAAIKEAPSVNFSAHTIARSIISDFTIIINEIRRVSEIAGQSNDEYTVALLSESLGFFKKYTWFFRAYLTSACPGY